jgi:hypothetical protein
MIHDYDPRDTIHGKFRSRLGKYWRRMWLPTGASPRSTGIIVGWLACRRASLASFVVMDGSTA